MIKSIIWILLMYSISIHSQGYENEWSCQIFSISLIDQKSSETRPLMVTFDFEIPSSLKQDLLNSDLINKEEKNAFKSVTQNTQRTICKKLKDLLTDRKVINVPGDYEEYDKIGYSYPLKVSCNKVFLIYERIIIKKNRPPSGGIIFETYERSNTLWKRIDRKILEMN